MTQGRNFSIINLDDYGILAGGASKVYLRTDNTAITDTKRTVYVYDIIATQNVSLPAATGSGKYFAVNLRSVSGSFAVNLAPSSGTIAGGVAYSLTIVNRPVIFVDAEAGKWEVMSDSHSNAVNITANTAAIALNTTHRNTVTGNPHNVLATQIPDFDTEVSNNTTVTDNASDIVDLQNDKADLAGGNVFTGTQKIDGVELFFIRFADANAATTIFESKSATLEVSASNLTDGTTAWIKLKCGISGNTIRIIDSDTDSLTVGTSSSGSDINIYWSGSELKIQADSSKLTLININGIIVV